MDKQQLKSVLFILCLFFSLSVFTQRNSYSEFKNMLNDIKLKSNKLIYFKEYNSSVIDSILQYNFRDFKSNKLKDISQLEVAYLIGGVFTIQNKIEEAEYYLKKADSLAIEKDNSLYQCKIALELANLHKNNTDFYKSTDFYIKALDIAKSINNTLFIAYCQMNLGYNYIRMNKYQIARSFLINSKSNFEKLNISSPEIKQNLISANLYLISALSFLKEDFQYIVSYFESVTKLILNTKNTKRQLQVSMICFYLQKILILKGK